MTHVGISIYNPYVYSLPFHAITPAGVSIIINRVYHSYLTFNPVTKEALGNEFKET